MRLCVTSGGKRRAAPITAQVSFRGLRRQRLSLWRMQRSDAQLAQGQRPH
jgi:hypothetical protein